MCNNAVINPATGETVRTYDTASDADIQAAITKAHEHLRMGSARPRWPSGQLWCAESPNSTTSGWTSWPT